MRVKTILGLLVAGAFILSGPSAFADSLGFSSWIGAAIDFDGVGGFTFTNGGEPGSDGNADGIDDDFLVTQGLGIGLYGNISGNFTIGAISSDGITAPVSGTGVFRISDGGGVAAANFFTADLTFLQIEDIDGEGTLNPTGTINLTNLSYGGTNADLLTLAGAPEGIMVTSFQFEDAVSLAQLVNPPPDDLSTSYSGSVLTETEPTTTVPEPGSTLLIGLGLAGIAIARRRSSK